MLRSVFALAAITLPLSVFAHGNAHPGHPSHSASASPDQVPQGLSVENCWVRTMPAQVPSAGYFVVRNAAAQEMTLTGVATPAFGATMLHRTVTQDGMARMLHADTIAIPGQGELVFEPGGYHAMLEKPSAALAVGDTIEMTFLFGEHGRITTRCELRSPASTRSH